jgi:hypothetical protein
MEITPCIISDHNALKLELNNRTTEENMQITGSEKNIAQQSVGHRRNRGNKKFPEANKK